MQTKFEKSFGVSLKKLFLVQNLLGGGVCFLTIALILIICSGSKLTFLSWLFMLLALCANVLGIYIGINGSKKPEIKQFLKNGLLAFSIWTTSKYCSIPWIFLLIVFSFLLQKMFGPEPETYPTWAINAYAAYLSLGIFLLFWALGTLILLAKKDQRGEK